MTECVPFWGLDLKEYPFCCVLACDQNHLEPVYVYPAKRATTTRFQIAAQFKGGTRSGNKNAIAVKRTSKFWFWESSGSHSSLTIAIFSSCVFPRATRVKIYPPGAPGDLPSQLRIFLASNTDVILALYVIFSTQRSYIFSN